MGSVKHRIPLCSRDELLCPDGLPAIVFAPEGYICLTVCGAEEFAIRKIGPG